jgi:hypothetical protein
MKYRNLLRNGQDAAAMLHATAHAIQRHTLPLPSTVWAVTYSKQCPGIAILAASDSRSVVVFAQGEIVFSAGHDGQVMFYQRGAWEGGVAMICEEAEQTGCLLMERRSLTQAELEANCPDFAACPWMDEIEATLEPWNITA